MPPGMGVDASSRCTGGTHRVVWPHPVPPSGAECTYPDVVPAPQLLPDDKPKRRRGCTDLVPFKPGTCPSCGADLYTGGSVQPALFIHGGFGEAREQVERSCACGWNGVGAKDFRSVNPRKL